MQSRVNKDQRVQKCLQIYSGHWCKSTLPPFLWQKRCQRDPIKNESTMKGLKKSIRRGIGEATSNSRWRTFFKSLTQIVKIKPSPHRWSRKSSNFIYLLRFLATKTQLFQRWVASSIFARVKKKNSFSSRTLKIDWWDENMTIIEESTRRDRGWRLRRSGSVNWGSGGAKTPMGLKISSIHVIFCNHQFPKSLSLRKINVETYLEFSTEVLRSKRYYIPTWRFSSF